MNSELNFGKVLAEFEKLNTEKLSKLKLKGFLFWQVIKSPLFFEVFVLHPGNVDNVDLTPIKRKTTFFSTSYKLIVFSFTLMFIALRNIFVKQPILVLAHSIDKLFLNEEKIYMNTVLDPLLKYLNKSNIIYVEQEHNFKLLKPSSIKTNLNEIGLRALSKLISFFIKKNEINECTYQLFNLLDPVFKTNKIEVIKPTFLYDLGKRFVADYYVSIFIYKILGIRKIISSERMASGQLAAACKLGIKFYETQHGFIDQYHASYIYDAAFKPYKKFMFLPQKIIVFGQFTKDLFMESTFWDNEQITSLGSYRVDKQRKFARNISQLNNILIITQAPCINEIIESIKPLSAYLVEFPEVKVFVKPHPLEKESNLSKYKEVINSNQIVLADKLLNVFNLLQTADLVIGIYSTTLLESIALGIPTVTMATEELPKGIYSKFDTNKLDGIMDIVTNPKSFCELIYKYCASKEIFKERVIHVKNESNFLYQNNFDENVIAFTNDILLK